MNTARRRISPDATASSFSISRRWCRAGSKPHSLHQSVKLVRIERRFAVSSSSSSSSCSKLCNACCNFGICQFCQRLIVDVERRLLRRLAIEPIGNLLDGPPFAIDRAFDQLVSDQKQVFALCPRIDLVQRGAKRIGERFFFCRPPFWVAGFPWDEGHLLINPMSLFQLCFIFGTLASQTQKPTEISGLWTMPI